MVVGAFNLSTSGDRDRCISLSLRPAAWSIKEVLDQSGLCSETLSQKKHKKQKTTKKITKSNRRFIRRDPFGVSGGNGVGYDLIYLYINDILKD